MVTTEIKWSSVSLNEIILNKYRFEASYFGYEGKKARETLDNCKWPIESLLDYFVENAYYPGRFKRVYVKKGTPKSIGFLGSSEMLFVKPIPIKFLLPSDNNLTVDENQILLSRSGTIGNVTYVSKTLKKYLISEHAIRITCKEHPGYIYAYLKSEIGRNLVKTNTYGAVVDQIEPEHLSNVPIPNPSFEIKQCIHNLIIESFSLRDESNELIDEAHTLLKDSLMLPDPDDIKPQYFDNSGGVNTFVIGLRNITNRMDASYHIPIVDVIEKHLEESAKEVKTVGDLNISIDIVLPGRFKRIYVKKDYGAVFFGGKQMLELDPTNKKYLSFIHHENRIKEQLTLHTNMVLISCSGTVGKVAIVPKHWEGWTANQHIIRIISSSEEMSGYLYAWLSSEYAIPLITHFVYGAVVDEIDDTHVSQIIVPILKDPKMQQNINDKILEANQKRYEAYQLEQKALDILSEKVIFAI